MCNVLLTEPLCMSLQVCNVFLLTEPLCMSLQVCNVLLTEPLCMRLICNDVRGDIIFNN